MIHLVPERSAHGLRFNPHVAALPPYNAGMNVDVARTISGQHDIARLASNENPEGCSPAVMRALAPATYEPWRYADPTCTALRIYRKFVRQCPRIPDAGCPSVDSGA